MKRDGLYSYITAGWGHIMWTAAGVLLFLILGILAWRCFPEYYARFYLTRSVLQTRGWLMDLWGKDPQGEGADEDCLKLAADEVEWNGHSVLVFPENAVISVPGITGTSVRTSQESLKGLWDFPLSRKRGTR